MELRRFATGNKVFMLEHAIYSVISPEGCASILWRSANESEKAAESLKLTAQDLLELEVIDEIIKEPRGGAHRDVSGICNLIKECILVFLNQFDGVSSDKIISQREEKYLCIGKKFLINLNLICKSVCIFFQIRMDISFRGTLSLVNLSSCCS